MHPANCQDQYVRGWLDFNRNISPVARPLDMLWFNQGGAAGSTGRKWKINQRNDPDIGKSGWWTVTSTNRDSDISGWAALRMALPHNIWGKTSGIRIRIKSLSEGTIVAYGYSGGENFYAVKNVGQRDIALKQGVNDLELTWSSLGADPAQVTAFGIAHSRINYSIGISRIDILFQDKKSADEYDAYQAQILNVMGEWLAARKLDIRGLRSKLTADEWESRAWQGAQLVAIGEQIEHWHSLAIHLGYKDSICSKLRIQRHTTIKGLEIGKKVNKEIAACQDSVDTYIDNWIKIIPVSKRKWYVGSDKRFHKPDGSAYRMFGPHYFRMLVDPNDIPDGAYNPWDIRYMSALGFNGMRLYVVMHHLEPTRGRFDPVYLKMVKDICHEAERYGIALSVDLHWQFPDWFVKGKPGLEPAPGDVNAYGSFQNSYQWPEALVDTWGRLAKELADVPNIAAWEVPANEPIIAAGPRGAEAYPAINKWWNKYLSETYGSLDRLNAVWSAAASGVDRYSLHPDENWNKDSIKPLGFQNDPDASSAYDYNPRLWDHVKWHADMQQDLTGRIMVAIRKQWPGAVGMMQRTIGDIWDRSPVPLSYYSIDTIRGKYVLPGTHYGMGNTLEALKASTQTYASYDSETSLLDSEKMVKQHVELGLGFCPFMYSVLGRGEGGPLLADDEGRLAPGALYLSKQANWIRRYWPKTKTGPKVAVILNGRLEAVMRSPVGNLIDMLHSRGCRIGVFNGLEIVENPKLLDGYKLVITSSSYMDVDLLRVLDENYKGKVFLHGRLDYDAYARRPEQGLAAELAKRKIILASSDVSQFSGSGKPPIDLSGEWMFKHMGNITEPGDNPPPANPAPDWLRIKVPSYWDNSGIMPYLTLTNVLGDAWYIRKVTVPHAWKGQCVKLIMGAIDDYDWTFFNGHLIGHTDSSTANAYTALRDYVVPGNIINWNGEDTIAVRVRNTFADGGIWKAPVELRCLDTGKVVWKNKTVPEANQESVVVSSSCSLIVDMNLRHGVEKLAILRSDEPETVAMVKQGRWFWWFSDLPWSESKDDNAALDQAVKGIVGK